MARSSQEAIAAVTRPHKAGYVKGKDKVLYPRATTSTPKQQQRVYRQGKDDSTKSTTFYESVPGSASRRPSNVLASNEGGSHGKVQAPPSYNTAAAIAQSRKTITSLSGLFNGSSIGVTNGHNTTTHQTSILEREDSSLFPARSSQGAGSEWSVEYVTNEKQDGTNLKDNVNVFAQRTVRDHLDKNVGGMRSEIFREEGEESQMGLLEFGKMEKQPTYLPQEKQKGLLELAEPLIDQMARIYENEWAEVVACEERNYKETATTLGTMLDVDLMAAASDMKNDVAAFATSQKNAAKTIRSELTAAKKILLGLIAKQKMLAEQFAACEARMVKSNDCILVEITNIRETYAEKLKAIETDYGHKADALDDRIEHMRNDKNLQNEFNSYLMKTMAERVAPAQDATRKTKTARRQTRG